MWGHHGEAMLDAFNDGFTEFYDGVFEGSQVTVFRCKKEDGRHRVFPRWRDDFASAEDFNAYIAEYDWVPAKLETRWRDLAAMIAKIRAKGDQQYLGE